MEVELRRGILSRDSENIQWNSIKWRYGPQKWGGPDVGGHAEEVLQVDATVEASGEPGGESPIRIGPVVWPWCWMWPVVSVAQVEVPVVGVHPVIGWCALGVIVALVEAQ